MRKIVTVLAIVLWAQVAQAGYVFYDTSTGLITGGGNISLIGADAYISTHPSESYLEVDKVPNRSVWRVDITASPYLRQWTAQELSDKATQELSDRTAKDARAIQTRDAGDKPTYTLPDITTEFKNLIKVLQDNGIL